MDRRGIEVEGTVQGVGFRPFVYRLARQHNLQGFVRNQAGRVHIEVQGETTSLDAFLQDLKNHSLSLAHIESIRCEVLPVQPSAPFEIENSSDGASDILLPVDTTICQDCLREMEDPSDRRFRYPFINCTQCGPRFTLIQESPYDRERTTMSSFAMCQACRREYEDPQNRRFHAEPIACPSCGPRLEWMSLTQMPSVFGEDALQGCLEELKLDSVVAIKGVGGFHLACDALSPGAVRKLQERKKRGGRPLAVMVADIETVEKFFQVQDEERTMLLSPQRPIVLLRRGRNCPVVPEVSEDNPWVGVFLPYTPLHHLLLRQWPKKILVLTSANRRDEPMVYQDEQAEDLLGNMVDGVLTHNRPIEIRCDDSVVRMAGIHVIMIRRSRGFVPEPIPLLSPCEMPILAIGGHLKTTIALGHGGHALLSPHVGDLQEILARDALEHCVEQMEKLFRIHPAVIAHDLHPDYASTEYSRRRCVQDQLQSIPVQHHHAHFASVLAENHRDDENMIGVIWDGTGLGLDGTIWGGEFLVGNCMRFGRAGHFRPAPMPGNEAAIREPWRMVISYLSDAGLGDVLEKLFPSRPVHLTRQFVGSGRNCPLTSSCGRLFDAVACLMFSRANAYLPPAQANLGLAEITQYEGQWAMHLEGLATHLDLEPFKFELSPQVPFEVDFRRFFGELYIALQRGVALEEIASRFHLMLVNVIVQGCEMIRHATGLKTVALSGGCFMNALLLRRAVDALRQHQFEVLLNQDVPPNDGGLAFGQLAVARARMSQRCLAATESRRH